MNKLYWTKDQEYFKNNIKNIMNKWKMKMVTMLEPNITEFKSVLNVI